jgi:hypothetical protein
MPVVLHVHVHVHAHQTRITTPIDDCLCSWPGRMVNQHGEVTYVAEPAQADAVAMEQQQNVSINNENKPVVPKALGYAGADPLHNVSHNPFRQDNPFRHTSEVRAGVCLELSVHSLFFRVERSLLVIHGV